MNALLDISHKNPTVGVDACSGARQDRFNRRFDLHFVQGDVDSAPGAAIMVRHHAAVGGKRDMLGRQGIRGDRSLIDSDPVEFGDDWVDSFAMYECGDQFHGGPIPQRAPWDAGVSLG